MATQKKRPATPASVTRRLDNVQRELEGIKSDLGVFLISDIGEAELMGVSEVAEALGISGALVSTWLARGKLPEPIARLKAGPVWSKRQLEGMIRLARQSR